ncbi:MAG: HAD family hydrolase [Phycisphaerales bacterium]|nr:HAD family hydrolase [Phycisphaerales bacterium]
MKRAIFLDRDNTIIHNDDDLGKPEEVRLIRGAAHAIGSLRQLGYRIIVVSNQGGVARGLYTERDVDAVHERIAQMVYDSAGAIIDRFYYCPFHPEGTVKDYAREHPWRKPQPGMLLEAARSLELDLRECWMVGDQERDIEAGRAAGCQTILITRKTSVTTRADFQAATLAEAAAIIAQNRVRTRQAPPAAPVVVTSRRPGEAAPIASPAAARVEAAVRAEHRAEAPAPPAPSPRVEPKVEMERLDDPREVEAMQVELDEAEATEELEAQQEVQEPAEASDEPPRRDPMRHIPVRLHGIERPRPARDQGDLPPSDRLLSDLLGEMRSWRQSQREFTPVMMFGSLAVLALLIVGVLLGVYLDAATATPWIGLTILAQLSVVALLLLNLRR